MIDRLNLEEEGLGAVKYVLGKGAFGKVVLGKCKGKKVAIKAVTKDQFDVTIIHHLNPVLIPS